MNLRGLEAGSQDMRKVHRFVVSCWCAVILAFTIGCEVPPEQRPIPERPDQCPLDSRLFSDFQGTKAFGDTALIGTYYDVSLDLPPALRTKNWGGGSCVHASTKNLFIWTNQYEMAEWWSKTYSGGEYADRLIRRLEAAGVRYAYTTKGDFEFLRWCAATRRGAGIFYKPNHAINFVGMNDQVVWLLDNNATGYPEQHGSYEEVPIEKFKANWRYYGGFAWTLVYNPAPPNPRMKTQP